MVTLFVTVARCLKTTREPLAGCEKEGASTNNGQEEKANSGQEEKANSGQGMKTKSGVGDKKQWAKTKQAVEEERKWTTTEKTHVRRPRVGE